MKPVKPKIETKVVNKPKSDDKKRRPQRCGPEDFDDPR